jgi:hypothetical protein
VGDVGSSRPPDASNPPSPLADMTHPPVAADPTAMAMSIINRIAPEIGMPPVPYVNMCKVMVSEPGWTTMIINMTDAGRWQWLLGFMD